MSWRDRLRPAAFRGVPFHVEVAEDAGGRRAAVHEFPGGEQPIVQDLGRRIRELTIEAYVVGDDYHAQLQRLLAALEEQGDGLLVHPYYGSMRCQVLTYRVRQSSREGRMARLQISLVRTREVLEQDGQPDPRGAADAAGAALGAAAERSLVASLDLSGNPAHIAAPAVSQVRSLTSLLQGVVYGGPVAAVSGLLREALRIADEAIFLVSQPAELARQTRVLVGLLEHAVGSRLATLRVLGWIYGLSSMGAGADVQRCFGSLALAAAVPIAARVPWESRQQAEAEAATWAERIDDALELADDLSLDALLGLRRALTLAVPPPGRKLPELRRLRLEGTASALPLAYRLYGDPRRGDEIVRRNRLRNPGVIPRGAVLEVLSA